MTMVPEIMRLGIVRKAPNIGSALVRWKPCRARTDISLTDDDVPNPCVIFNDNK